MRPPKRGIITRKSASASPALAFGDSDLVLLEDFRERSRGRSFPGIRGWLNGILCRGNQTCAAVVEVYFADRPQGMVHVSLADSRLVSNFPDRASFRNETLAQHRRS